jgi:hypothetical protein
MSSNDVIASPPPRALSLAPKPHAGGTTLFSGCLLELFGTAKILIGIRAPTAFLAYEFCILYKLFVILKAIVEVSHIYQIAKMFIMHGVRQLGLIHISPFYMLFAFRFSISSYHL